MKKRYKIVLWSFLALFAVIFSFIILYSYTPIIDKAILRFINLAVDKNVTIRYSKLEGNLLGDLRIQSPQIIFGGDTLTASSISVNYSAEDLLEGYLNIKYLSIDEPMLVIHSESKDKEGQKELKSAQSIDTLLSKIDLSGLPKMTISELLVRNGKVRIIEDNDQQNLTQIHLAALGEIQPEKVEFRVKYIKGLWLEKNLPLNQLSFVITGNQQRVTLNQLTMDLPGAEVYAHGEIEFMPVLRFLVFVDTSKVDISLIRQFSDSLPFKTGYLDFYGEYIGNPKDFTGNLYFHGAMDSIMLSKISFRYDYHYQAFSLRNINIATNFGYLSGGLQVAPEGKNKVALNFREVDLKRIGVTEYNTNINGLLALDFNTWNLKKISGNGMARLYNLAYNSSRIDSVYLNLKVNQGDWELQKKSRMVVEKSSQFFMDGELSREGIVDFNFYTDENVIDTLAKRLNLGPLGGMGSLDINVSGKIIDPDISGYVLLDSLLYQNNRAYGVEGNFQIGHIFSERLGYFKLDLSSGIIQHIPLTDGLMSLKIDKNIVMLDTVSFYNEDNYITLQGKIEQLPDKVNINLTNFNFLYENYSITATDTLMAVLKNDSLIVEDFVLNATGNGEIEVRGMLDFSGESGLAVYFKNIQLFPFNQFLRWEYSLQGLMEISVEITGEMKNPLVETYLALQNFIMDTDTVGNVDARFVYDNRLLEIDYFQLKKAPATSFSMKGQLVIPEDSVEEKERSLLERHINFTADFNNIDIQNYPFFKQFNFPVTGNFGGHVELTGQVNEPVGSYNLSGQDIRFQDYSIPNFEFDGHLSDSSITLDQGKLNFMNTDIILQGEKTINWDVYNFSILFSDRSFSLLARIQEDSVNFLNVLTPEVDLLMGKIDAVVNIGGTIDSPEIIDGHMNVNDGTLYLSKLENPVTNLQFESVFEGRLLKIKKCNGLMLGEVQDKNLLQKFTSVLLSPVRKLLHPSKKNGRFHLSGNVDFAELDRPKIYLKLNASQVYINYYLENARLLVSVNNFTITGKDTLLVKGDVTIHKGEVDLNLKESEKNLLLISGTRETPPFLQYMINVSIPGNFYVRSSATFNSFDMMITGDLQVSQEPKSTLEMYGNLEVPKGKYFQFEDFNIRNGRIEFINPKELPNLDIIAETKKYGFLFQLHVTGDLNNPVKEIKIFDLQTQQDITHLYPETKDQISLLLFGVTFSELGSSAGNLVLDKGQEVISQALISRVEREARQFIGLDEIRVENSQSTVDYTTQRLNMPSESSVLSLGKYITPDLYLEYKTQLGSAGLPIMGEIPTPRLGWDAGDQIYLEYRINRNWSVSTYYEKQLYDKFKVDLNWQYNF